MYSRRREAVVAAAVQWWLGKRPLAYSVKQHIKNPAVNCASDLEAELGAAVGRYIEEQQT